MGTALRLLSEPSQLKTVLLYHLTTGEIPPQFIDNRMSADTTASTPVSLAQVSFTVVNGRDSVNGTPIVKDHPSQERDHLRDQQGADARRRLSFAT